MELQKQVAILGGSGFVGSAIYKECLKRNQLVWLLDKSEPLNIPTSVRWMRCDILNTEQLEKCLVDISPFHLYILAGVLGTSELNKTPSLAAQVNITGITNIIELHLKKILPPVFFVTKPNVWENMYTISKSTAERILIYYMKSYGLKGVIHKWYNVYGPNQHSYPVRKAVPFFIINALFNKPLNIWGDGSQTMDLLFVEDVAYCAVEAMNNGKYSNEDVIEIGSGIPVTVIELAQLIIKLCKSNSFIKMNPMREGEVERTILFADTSKLKNLIQPNYEFINLEKGLIQTINHYKNLPNSYFDDFFKFYNSIFK